MNIELTRAAWRNHTHHNARFLRPTPRTLREAFGAGEAPPPPDLDLYIGIGLCLALLAGMVLL